MVQVEGDMDNKWLERKSKHAAEDMHTVVRGYDGGSHVVRTVVTDEGVVVEESLNHANAGEPF